jgi:hypothetical protein
MSEIKLGNGIRKSSARPVKIHVASDGEIWYCDESVNPQGDFGGAGCSPLSESVSGK